MMRKQNDRRYSRISNIREIRMEKEHLRGKIRLQEKELARDWRRIEDGWQIFGKIAGIWNSLFSSVSMLGSFEIGYKLLSFFFSKKKKQKNAKQAIG